MASFYGSLPECLNALLLGEEDDLRRASGKSYSSGAVRLMTLHGSKGDVYKRQGKHGEHLFPGGWGIRQQPVPIPLENSHPHRLRHIFIVPGIF